MLDRSAVGKSVSPYNKQFWRGMPERCILCTRDIIDQCGTASTKYRGLVPSQAAQDERLVTPKGGDWPVFLTLGLFLFLFSLRRGSKTSFALSCANLLCSTRRTWRKQTKAGTRHGWSCALAYAA